MRLLSLALLFCFTASIAWSQPPTLAPDHYHPIELRGAFASKHRERRYLDPIGELQQLRRDVAANQREINYEFQRVRAVVAILRDRQMQIHRMLAGEHVELWEEQP